MRRVVVTGLGLVTPLGGDVETTWANLIAGESGAGQITRFDASNQKCTIACEVKGKDHPWGFDADKRVDHKVQRQVDPFIIYGIDAAGQALEDAGLTDMTQAEKERTGCSIGSGIGGLPGIELESVNLHERGPSRVSPHFVHGRLINLITGQVQIKYGFMGPNHAVVTACSTGAHSIGDAARMIMADDADVMLAGGAESTINPLGIAGFAQARALNMSMNDRPTEASRPYDKNRDGFVMGEGAGVVVLEEYERAKARGAKIYGEIVGYAANSDGYDMVAPSGEGAARCMNLALAGAIVAGTATLAAPAQAAAVPAASPAATAFDLSTFGRAPAKFDEEDLERLNAAIVHQLPFSAVAERLPQGMDEAGWHAIRPNLAHVALVVAWFGNDLRAGHCSIRPKVETESRNTTGMTWQVGPVTRESAQLVSQIGGRPAFGGTPCDASVIAAIRDLKARGLKVTLYPFLLMDIAAGNGLSDPYGGTEQAAYPWRGRITAYPLGADKTASARTQVSTFVTRSEGYRRFVLHYAALAASAGGVGSARGAGGFGVAMGADGVGAGLDAATALRARKAAVTAMPVPRRLMIAP